MPLTSLSELSVEALTRLGKRIDALGRPPFVSWPQKENRQWREELRAWEAEDPRRADVWSTLMDQYQEIAHAIDVAASERMRGNSALRLEPGIIETDAVRAVRDWLVGGRQYLLLYGGIGTGKSMALEAVMRRERDCIVRAVDIKGAYAEVKNGLWRRLLEAPTLGLDDIGTEGASDFAKEALWNLMDARHSARRRAVITSNLTVAELRGHLGERISDRIRESFEQKRMTGPSLRGRIPPPPPSPRRRAEDL